jgi:preprotein translocase subunit YajC
MFSKRSFAIFSFLAIRPDAKDMKKTPEPAAPS